MFVHDLAILAADISSGRQGCPQSLRSIPFGGGLHVDGFVRLVPGDLEARARAVFDIASVALEVALEIVSAAAPDDEDGTLPGPRIHEAVGEPCGARA